MIMKTMLISTLMIQNDKNDDNFFSFNLKMFFIVSPKSTYNQQQHCRHINLFNSIYFNCISFGLLRLTFTSPSLQNNVVL